MVAVGQALLGVALAVVGGGVGYGMARRKWARRRELKRAERVEARSLEPGPVELQGKAIPAEETFTSPLTGQECLAYEYEVEKLRVKHRSEEGRRKGWVPVENQERAAPFYVDDGTGRALVDAPVADLELERAYEVDTEDVATSTAGKVLATITGRDTGPDAPVTDERLAEMREAGKRRRYREHLIRPDESVYVYGQAVAPQEAGPAQGGFLDALGGLVGSDDTPTGEAITSLVSGGREDYRRFQRHPDERQTREERVPDAIEERVEELQSAADRLEGAQGRDPEDLTREQRELLEEGPDTIGSMLDGTGSSTTAGGSGSERGIGGIRGERAGEDAGDGILADERLVVSRGESVGELVVSDREKSGVTRAYAMDALKWAAGGLAAVGFGAFTVAWSMDLLSAFPI